MKNWPTNRKEKKELPTNRRVEPWRLGEQEFQLLTGIPHDQAIQ